MIDPDYDDPDYDDRDYHYAGTDPGWELPYRPTLTVYLPGVSCDHPNASTGDEPFFHPHRWQERADQVDEFRRAHPEYRFYVPRSWLHPGG